VADVADAFFNVSAVQLLRNTSFTADRVDSVFSISTSEKRRFFRRVVPNSILEVTFGPYWSSNVDISIGLGVKFVAFVPFAAIVVDPAVGLGRAEISCAFDGAALKPNASISIVRRLISCFVLIL
jgi:hypothetical protein